MDCKSQSGLNTKAWGVLAHLIDHINTVVIDAEDRLLAVVGLATAVVFCLRAMEVMA